MSIYLGNLSIERMEEQMGIKFPEPFRTEFGKTRQHSADTSKLAKNGWHCFDMPFVLVCGSRKFAQNIANELKPLVPDITTPLQVTIQEATCDNSK